MQVMYMSSVKKKEVRKPFQMLLGESERARLERAARRASLPLGTWMRSVCMTVAKETK